jgi:Flp pilus assembly protein TadG
MMLYTLGTIMTGLFLAAIGVDTGFYFSAQNQMQTVADAGALAGAQAYFKSEATSTSQKQTDAKAQVQSVVNSNQWANLLMPVNDTQDIVFGYVNPATKVFSKQGFGTASNNSSLTPTGGYNALAVVVRKNGNTTTTALPSVMAQLFGINTMQASASSVAMFDNTIGEVNGGGLRPFYGCMAQFNKANTTGTLKSHTARIYGGLMLDGANVTGCPSYTSGNWGYADLRDGNPGSPGTSTVREWIQYGFGEDASSSHNRCIPSDEKPVKADKNYSVQPGNAISASSSEIQTLINQKTVITIPLVDSLTGSGSNTKAHVVGFSGFVITGQKSTGPASGRYVEGYFTKALCGAECSTGATVAGGGLSKIRMVN